VTFTCDLLGIVIAVMNLPNRWLSVIKLLLSSAAAVARSLSDGHAVLVHCSHGWDRTPQVCALAEVMLDGHYRSIAGLPLKSNHVVAVFFC
jgi:protein tyrosine/serine phosphatase